jgi:hypothetical protein
MRTCIIQCILYITAAHLSSQAVIIQSMSTKLELYTLMKMET